ncbi:protease I [Branchiibius hedensis]|uniref:Protease I n=1 Tax=Branchiibius hedensis TaxID=672460 RepID=A0A2Y8ZTD9_9MICO|nr:DJ-1/PfpI/YhbO family deglycase/protease [Branchiibius hedensis]PWJ26343.1 protease I [Branchiibius hedensis]SSA35155.1 protease I [Branchiibius hedensis]
MAEAAKNVLFIATSYGVERDEIVEPHTYVTDAGYRATVATPDNTSIQTLVDDKDAGPVVASTARLSDVVTDDYDLLVIPGGTINADTLRQDGDAVRLVKEFVDAGKPIAAICHAPWLMVEADAVVGKTLTSYPSVRTDINNAGGTWVNEAVVADETNGFTLITSRTPDDVEQFNHAIGKQLG